MLRVEVLNRQSPMDKFHLGCLQTPEMKKCLHEAGVEMRFSPRTEYFTPDVDVAAVCLRRDDKEKYESILEKALSLPRHVPILMWDWSDFADVSRRERKCLLCYRVSGIYKSKLFRDLSFYRRANPKLNDQWEQPGEHHRIFRRLCPDLYMEGDFAEPLPLDTGKLGLWPCSATWLRMQYLRENGPEDKPIDVFFAGTTNYGKTPITTHRRLCCEAMARLPDSWNVKVFDSSQQWVQQRDYFRLCLQSKIFVSPWGWGAASYRDFESVFSAAAMIKPPAGFIRTWPDVLPSAITCNPDFTDLRERCEEVLDTWEDRREGLLRGREEILQATTSEKVAHYLAAHFYRERENLCPESGG